MIFQHTWKNVLTGKKTQTRRIVKPRQMYDSRKLLGLPPAVFTVAKLGDPAPRVLYEVGKTYAVQSGRGKVSIARIRLTDIRWEDVRNISEQDAAAEGFQDQEDFWFTWISMHDKRFLETYRYASDMGHLSEYGFYSRPPERYDAWVLTFELVK